MREAATVPHWTGREVAGDERVLVQAACENPAAFGALYEQYRDRVYWYLRTRTTSTEDAADLLQQVFLQALDRLPQYNPSKGPFVAWLFGIARNAASNQHRRRRITVSWDLLPEVLRPASQDDPEAEALHNESLTRLTTIFRTLDRGKRELLVLRFVSGLSIVEIAAVIGKSEAATKQHLRRTLQALKEQYDDHA